MVSADTASHVVVGKEVVEGAVIHYPGSQWSGCVTSVVCGNTAAQLMNTDPLHVGWCAGVSVVWTVLISMVVICESNIPL